MKKISIFLILILFIMSAPLTLFAEDRSSDKQEKDVSAELEKAAVEAEKNLDTFIEELGEIITVVKDKIVTLKPKLEKIKSMINDAVEDVSVKDGEEAKEGKAVKDVKEQ